ncbi:glycosyltransferase family 2 protein [Acuticoccus sediminis]|nr:glycosyltransferase family 2 protein [Acuticoccus sediminis]
MQAMPVRVVEAFQPEKVPSVAVLLPCYNEAGAVGAVIDAFRRALPDATIFVYDNNSTDGTAEIAAAHGAVLRREPRQGKGYVVRRMFADIDADIYVLADGDDTYDAESAPRLITMLLAGPNDVVNGGRVALSNGAYRPGHRLGNKLLSGMVRLAFGANWTDMLSGYKVMSRRFVKSFPITSRGFEIETELLIHTMESRAPSAEVMTPYRERNAETVSKLRTFRDGFRILRLILLLIKDERPLLFFSAVAALLSLIALILATPILIEYAETGLVPRLPTAVLATGLVLMSALSLVTGFVLDGIATARREFKQLFYLSGLPAKD